VGVISRLYDFVAGHADRRRSGRSELNQILGVLNGNIDQANLKNGEVTYAKLAAATQNAFLKLLVSADKKVSFGTWTASGFGSTGDYKTSSNIAHGLPNTPDRVLITQRDSSVDGSGNNAVGVAFCKTKDATNITIRAFSVASAIAPLYDITFDWVAIG
jgi:hypothetical protein